jgi:hypothetical protein
MFTKTAIVLAIVLGSVTSSLAAVKMGAGSSFDVYDHSRGYIGTDPDANIRGQLLRDNGSSD